MFEFEPDEYIFTKFAYFFKRKRKEKQARLAYRVTLEEIKSRLTLISRAITGAPIEIYNAEREGGYKNHNFFLPSEYSEFKEVENNLTFYVFRTLYLSVQKNLDINWTGDSEYDIKEVRVASKNASTKVLDTLFDEFPISKTYYKKLIEYYTDQSSKEGVIDDSFVYGKLMKDNPDVDSDTALQNITDRVKSKTDDDIKTTIKAKAVEEIISVEVDKKQLEDAVVHHQFEKVETADEFSGNFKDMDGDDELDDHSNALEELSMKHTVRVDDPVHSVYQTDFIENTTISESAETDNKGYHIKYDEWDYSTRAYKENFCKVYPQSIVKSNVEYYKKTINDNRSTLAGLRKLLSTVNNKYQLQRRKSQGEEIDIDAVIDYYVDVHSGHTPSEKIYFSKRKKEKDLSILLLLDVSLSSDGYAAGNRVIDIEKQVSILFGEILNEFNIDFSINSFYSKTRNYSNYVTLKGFDEDWNKAKFKVGAIEPSGYTRIGSALRHSGALLDKRDTKNKWVILISDGKPNDYDKYEGKYGINDVKQALRELNERQINSYALAIEAQAKYYLPQMFGQNHYQILTTPVELLQSLVKLYERIKHKS